MILFQPYRAVFNAVGVFSSFSQPYGGCAVSSAKMVVLRYRPYPFLLLPTLRGWSFVFACFTEQVLISFCQPYGAGLFVFANLTGLVFLYLPALRSRSFVFGLIVVCRSVCFVCLFDDTKMVCLSSLCEIFTRG